MFPVGSGGGVLGGVSNLKSSKPEFFLSAGFFLSVCLGALRLGGLCLDSLFMLGSSVATLVERAGALRTGRNVGCAPK